MEAPFDTILSLPQDELCSVLRYRKFNSRLLPVDDAYFDFLCASLKDERIKVRRYAAIAVGRESEDISIEQSQKLEQALLQSWQQSPQDNERRPIAEALGKVGSHAAEQLLQSVETQDVLLQKSLSKALLLLARRQSKAHATVWMMNRKHNDDLQVRAWCRHGLESLVAFAFDEQKASFTVQGSGLGWVDLLLHNSPLELYKNRFALDFGFTLPVASDLSRNTAKVIAETLLSPFAQSVFSTFASAPYRVRVELMNSGTQRSLQWEIAEQIAQLSKASGFDVLNDSRQADWEAVISFADNSIDLKPKSFVDPRFFYRLKDVPAASHPTIAAALAYVAGVRKDDVVWDPFVGSGSELIERHQLGAYRQLIGSDLELAALENTRTNMECAGLPMHSSSIVLIKADALSYRPQTPVSLIVSNPPMGRRVQVHDAEALLLAFVRRLPQILHPKGRLVWMSPFPQKLDRELRALGLTKTFHRKVDMGGFSAELQKWEGGV